LKISDFIEYRALNIENSGFNKAGALNKAAGFWWAPNPRAEARGYQYSSPPGMKKEYRLMIADSGFLIQNKKSRLQKNTSTIRKHKFQV
jgi:hypothetical protein